MELSAKAIIACAPIWKPVKHILWTFIANIISVVHFFLKNAIISVWQDSKHIFDLSFQICLSMYDHGTIVPTGMTWKKTPCYFATQFAGGLLFEKLKYFEAMLYIFEFLRVWEMQNLD